MKDSGIEWIGEIPEGWEVAPIRSCFDEVRTKNTNGQEQNALQFKFGNIISKTNFNANADDYVADAITNYTVVLPDTVMINGLNLNYDFKSLRVALVKEKGVITSAYLAIFPDRKKISPQYATYLFKGYETKMAFHNMGAGIRKTLGYKEFKNQPLLLPSEKEQNKISAYLDSKCSHIDIMLSKIRSSIEEYKKLKQAVITQAVTKGVRGEREMKDSGVEWIGEIPKEWVCEKIKYATSISRGLFNHRPRNDERYYNGKYPFIQTGDVANATKYIVSYSQTLNELGKSVSKEFPKGTLTMTIAANVGDVAILNFDAYFPDSVVGFVPNKNIRTLYLFYVFSAMKDEFIRTAIKSTQLNLNIDRVKETFIPVTLNVNEQCEIENYLESKCAEIDGLIAKKEQLVKELESYKKSLIYEVVTGKREV
ncbi:restriction endonuclease subunit S [Ruminococcus sp.]|uniref:restriction endonuclease subunit S n=1 Tax=Ruminococcus sp. TaxID=41978 RepID=UPI003FD76CD0